MDFRPPWQGLPHLDHYSCHIIIVDTSAVTSPQPQFYTQHDKVQLYIMQKQSVSVHHLQTASNLSVARVAGYS